MWKKIFQTSFSYFSLWRNVIHLHFTPSFAERNTKKETHHLVGFEIFGTAGGLFCLFFLGMDKVRSEKEEEEEEEEEKTRLNKRPTRLCFLSFFAFSLSFSFDHEDVKGIKAFKFGVKVNKQTLSNETPA